MIPLLILADSINSWANCESNQCYIRSQKTVESDSTDECERIHTSEILWNILLAHVNLKNNAEDF